MAQQQPARTEKLSGIFLENEFMRGLRAKTLRRLFGCEAICALQVVWGDLSDSVTGQLDEVAVTTAAAEYLAEDRIQDFLAFCVKESLLDFKNDFYFSRTITDRKNKRAKDRARKTRGNDMESARKTRGKQTATDGRTSKVLSLKSDVLSLDQKEGDPLLQFGKFIRMTQPQMEKLVGKFGWPLIEQEIPEAEEWIENADHPNAKKYQQPTHNHYLFLRSTWLKGKRLEGSSTNSPSIRAGAARGKMTTYERNEELLRKISEKENQNVELIGFGHNKVSDVPVLRVRQEDHSGAGGVLEGAIERVVAEPGVGGGKSVA